MWALLMGEGDTAERRRRPRLTPLLARPKMRAAHLVFVLRRHGAAFPGLCVAHPSRAAGHAREDRAARRECAHAIKNIGEIVFLQSAKSNFDFVDRSTELKPAIISFCFESLAFLSVLSRLPGRVHLVPCMSLAGKVLTPLAHPPLLGEGPRH